MQIVVFLLQWGFVALLFAAKSNNKAYYIFVMMQAVSLLLAPLIGRYVSVSSFLTLFNTLFCFVNLYLIVSPWRFARFSYIRVKDEVYFHFFQKTLYKVLTITIINNIIVLLIVLIFMPNIATFKASRGFRELYDTIPYFGILFRYTSVSRYIGVFALSYFIFYLHKGNVKKALIALAMSSSTLIAALAFYSRSQIVTYVLLLLCSYLYARRSFLDKVRQRIDKYIRTVVFFIVVFFAIITVVRFSAMEYYGDRIPQSSYIQDPIIYSIVDYTSKGFPFGIDQLEYHEDKDILYGKQCVYSVGSALAFFKIIDWDIEEYAETEHASFTKPKLSEENDEGSFHGYTCRMVKNFGYLFTLLFDLLFYTYISNRTQKKDSITFFVLVTLVYLMGEPVISLFGMDYDMFTFPILYYIAVRFFFKLFNSKLQSRCIND